MQMKDAPARMRVIAVAILSCGCALGTCRSGGPLPPPGPAAGRATAPSVGDTSFLGTNLSGMVDWSTEEPFTDYFKTARVFASGTVEEWSDGRVLDRNSAGWVQRVVPGQVARTVMFTDSGRYRPGRYVVRYAGRGEIRYGGSARLVADESRHGRDVLEVSVSRDSTGIAVDLLSVDAEDPVRDFRVYGPGGACADDRARWCDESTPCPIGDCLTFEEHAEELTFNPDFIQRLRPYRMLRFMDFMNTNNSTIRTWQDRPTAEDATWTDRGVPLEIMIRLANQTRTRPWFCIPHQADDDYVRSFAEQVRDQLDPSIPVWIEYSNEIWNSMFEQHRYAQEQGERLGLGTEFEAVLHFQSRRSAEIFRIFEEVLGNERLVRVLAAQASNPWVAEQLLSFEDTGRRTDALAIAPYFGVSTDPERRAELAGMSVDQLVRRSRDEWIPESLEWTRRHVELSRSHGLPLVAYEGGQHFVGVNGAENDEALNARFDALNGDPRMKDLYLGYLEGWRQTGGEWFNHFVNCDRWSKWGRWGALEYVRQPRGDAPKFDALASFAERYPDGW